MNFSYVLYVFFQILIQLSTILILVSYVFNLFVPDFLVFRGVES